jgi:hypothetical protein
MHIAELELLGLMLLLHVFYRAWGEVAMGFYLLLVLGAISHLSFSVVIIG